MEDIRLGRRTYDRTVAGNVAVGGTVTVPANPKRIGLIVGSNSAGQIDIHVDSVDANNLTYLSQFRGDINTFSLSIDKHGMLVTRRLVLRNSTASIIAISFTEFILDDK